MLKNLHIHPAKCLIHQHPSICGEFSPRNRSSCTTDGWVSLYGKLQLPMRATVLASEGSSLWFLLRYILSRASAEDLQHPLLFLLWVSAAVTGRADLVMFWFGFKATGRHESFVGITSKIICGSDFWRRFDS